MNLHKVYEFLLRAGHISLQDLELQMSLIEEEVEELKEAVEGYRDALKNSGSTDVDLILAKAHVAKEVADVLYTTVGMAWLLGFGKQLPDIFDIVADANLEKVRGSFWTTGRGKVLKTHPNQSKEVVHRIHGLILAETVNKSPTWARLVYRLSRLVSRIPRLPSRVYLWTLRAQVWYVRKSFDKSLDFPVETKGEKP